MKNLRLSEKYGLTYIVKYYKDHAGLFHFDFILDLGINQIQNALKTVTKCTYFG